MMTAMDIEITDITPYGKEYSRRIMEVCVSLKANVTDDWFTENLLTKNMDKWLCMVPDTHPSYYYSVDDRGSMIIYINIFENEKFDRRGERYAEIKVTVPVADVILPADSVGRASELLRHYSWNNKKVKKELLYEWMVEHSEGSLVSTASA